MNDVPARLSRCFSAAFPGLKPDQVASATVQSVAAWDSVATVTLLALIEEEFGVQVDLEAPDRFESYRGLLDYLTGLPVKS